MAIKICLTCLVIIAFLSLFSKVTEGLKLPLWAVTVFVISYFLCVIVAVISAVLAIWTFI